jgi:5-(carboxyamino)imidazole ribonucleotide mutase
LKKKIILVGIIMGSDSDLPIMKEAAEILDTFGVPNEVTVVSAHRTARRMIEYAADAKKRGIEVIIAGAGGAAHLPGMVASITPLPVIGVPIKTKSLDGLDSLLSIAQMPPGVPVATVAINGAKNAGIFACQILAANHPDIAKKIEKYKKDLEGSVLEKVDAVGRMGVRRYLKMLEKK